MYTYTYIYILVYIYIYIYVRILDYYVRVDWKDIPALSEARNTCQDVTISYYITAEVLGEIPTGGKF